MAQNDKGAKGATALVTTSEDPEVQRAAGGILQDLKAMSSLLGNITRDEKQIKEAALAELELYPEFASTAYYSIPRKNHVQGCADRKNCACPQKPTEDISIKGAMALARRWGCCVNAVRVVEETDKRVMVEGLFYDLVPTPSLTKRAVSVSKVGKSGSGYYQLPDDVLNQAIQAGFSKAVRNAILNHLPVGLKLAYFAKAKAVASGQKKEGQQDKVAPNAKVKEVCDALVKEGCTREQITKFLGKEKGVTFEDVARLSGVLNAIREGMISAKNAFNPPEDPTPPDATQDGGMLEELLPEGGAVAGPGTAPQQPVGPEKPAEPPLVSKEDIGFGDK